MFDLVKLILLVFFIIYSVIWLNKNNCSPILKFTFWLVLIRLVLAAFHEHTFKLIGPVSIISVYSIVMVATCFIYLLINKQSIIFSKDHLFIKCILLVMCLSALLNNQILTAIPSIIKWIFLLQFTLLLLLCMRNNGADKVLKALLIAYSYPCSLLIFSIVLGEVKASEADGSKSFIGGYFHEAVFSMIIFTAAALYLSAKLIDGKQKDLYFLPMLSFFIVMLLLINYRTTLVAFMFTVMFVLYARFNRQIYCQRIVYVLSAAGFLFIASMLDFSTIRERFIEIPEVIMNASALIDYPEYYTRDEQRLFSGRVYMWSLYIAEALDGSSLQFFIGQGMDSWNKVFLKYAHNTFVSFFYELGIVGVILLIGFFSGIAKKILLINNHSAKYFLFGFFISFVIINLGTMPMWQMEGIMFASILISLTHHLSRDTHAID